MSDMTDREMLELAAKAAGIDYKANNADWRHEDHCAFWTWDDLCTCGARWNPLTDDGDAFRLMVKLGIYITWGAGLSDGKLVFADEIDEPCGTDPCAATRRAITRAAAEIGRNMK